MEFISYSTKSKTKPRKRIDSSKTMSSFPQAGEIRPYSGLTNPMMGDTWSNSFASIDPVFLSFFGTAN